MFVPEGRPARFRCPLCAAASNHPMDALHRYCARCGYVDNAVLWRAIDRGWDAEHPPLSLGVAGSASGGLGADAWYCPGPPVARIGLSAQLWRVKLLPAQLRRAVDLLLAHCEARSPGLVEPVSPGGRGAPHGWGRTPPDALEEDCEGGPLVVEAGWPAGAPEPELAFRPGAWGGCRFGLSAVRELDDWAVVVVRARGAGGPSRVV